MKRLGGLIHLVQKLFIGRRTRHLFDLGFGNTGFVRRDIKFRWFVAEPIGRMARALFGRAIRLPDYFRASSSDAFAVAPSNDIE